METLLVQYLEVNAKLNILRKHLGCIHARWSISDEMNRRFYSKSLKCGPVKAGRNYSI